MLTRDWRLFREHRDITGRVYKRIYQRYVPGNTPDEDAVEVCEEWIEDAAFAQAQLERDKPMFQGKDMKPLAVMPLSEESRAIREGWINDKKELAKWAKNIDNRKVQV